MTVAENGMWGADTEQLDALARDLRAAAERLGTIQSTIRAKVHASPWKGRKAESFRADWDGTYRARLQASAQAMRMAADSLNRNASDQRSTSAAGGSGRGSTSASTLLPGAAAALTLGLAVDEAVSKTLAIPGVLNDIRRPGYDWATRQLQKIPRSGDLFKYRKSPVIKGLERLVREPSPAAKGLKYLDHMPLLKFVGVPTLVNDAWNVSQEFVSGDVAHGVRDGVDVVAGAVQFIPSPMTYLAAFDVKLANHVIQEGAKIDFSAEGLDAVIHPGPGAGRAVWDAEVNGLKRILPDLL